MTDSILEHKKGEEDRLDIGTFATSIAELSEWKAKEQEEIKNQVQTERDNKIAELNQQTDSIITGAVESNKDRLGHVRLILRMILWWPVLVALLFAGIGSALSWIIGSWGFVWITLLPIVIKGFEMFFASDFLEKAMLKKYMPKAEAEFDKRIERNLRPAEQPYKETIIQQVKKETPLWMKCQSLVNS